MRQDLLIHIMAAAIEAAEELFDRGLSEQQVLERIAGLVEAPTPEPKPPIAPSTLRVKRLSARPAPVPMPRALRRV